MQVSPSASPDQAGRRRQFAMVGWWSKNGQSSGDGWTGPARWVKFAPEGPASQRSGHDGDIGGDAVQTLSKTGKSADSGVLAGSPHRGRPNGVAGWSSGA